jgi:hypothetical protein
MISGFINLIMKPEFTRMAVELLEFLPQRLAADLLLQIVECFRHRKTAVAPPLVVTRQTVISSALDVQRSQVLSHQVSWAEEILRQVGVE